MTDLNDMVAFAAVVRHGSYSQASRALGVPKATLSRRVSQLECRLGARLLHRSTRKVVPTEAGTVYYEHCERVVQEARSGDEAVAALQEAPRGVLRIRAPHAITETLLSPLLPEFIATHPEITVSLTVSSDATNPVAQGADVIVTGRPVTEASFPTRVLLESVTHLYASPRYLGRRRTPVDPGELGAHRTLYLATGSPKVRATWTLSRGERTLSVPIAPVFVSNDARPLRKAALDGLGIVLASDLAMADDEAAGQIVRVLPEWSGRAAHARVLLPSRVNVPPKTRAFVDYLVRRTRPSGR